MLKWGALVSLPFVVLVRGTMIIYHQQWPWPAAMAVGVLAASGVLLFYITWGQHRVGGGAVVRGRPLRRQAIAVLVVVSAFQAYVLLPPDPAHIQSEAVRAEYRSLHPVLRTSVALLLLADDGLLITDLARHPDDYDEMGLPINPRSLHYRQADGYAHAMDLRTRGHSVLRNGLVQLYFEGLGFRTRRHVGTADHLHVALPLPVGTERRLRRTGP